MPSIGNSDNHFGQLQYPSDMEAGDTYFPEAIHFHFEKKLGADFNDIGKAFKDSMSLSENNLAINQAEENAVNEAKRKYNSTVRETGNAPWNDDMAQVVRDKFTRSGLANFAYNVTQGYNVVEVAGRATLASGKELRKQNTFTEAVGDIYLNMPNNISLNEEAAWGGESLGVVGALSKAALKADKAGSTPGQMIAGAGAGGAGNLIAAAAGGIVGGILSKIPGVSGWMGGLLGAIGGGAINRGVGAAFSVTQNPYMEMMFSGIGFRQFKFDFIFRARNKSEIDRVAKIIKMFRQHSRPAWVGGSLGKSFMKYPGEYQIKFLTLEGKNIPDDFHPQHGMYIRNQYLPTLKPCICSSVETNFTPDNIWSAYKAGAPVAITLGLTFSETELVMADDIEKEYPNNSSQSNSNNLFNDNRPDEPWPE